MSSDPRYDIVVEARAQYMPEQSKPNEDRFVFAYHVTITNRGSLPAKLLGRHWFIVDAEDRVREVEGEGVVGECPTLEPGEYYEYTSGSIIETEVGAMYGAYRMVGADGHRFDADIPAFTLAVPGVLH